MNSNSRIAKVMFTAVADLGGKYGPFVEDRPLVFNKEILNVGGHYDCTSGIFKASVSGYYYFTFFYHAGKGHQSGLTLVKNDGEVIIGAFDNNNKGPDCGDNAGNAVFLRLEMGETVSMRLPGDCHVYTSDNTTSFSGFLVSEV